MQLRELRLIGPAKKPAQLRFEPGSDDREQIGTVRDERLREHLLVEDEDVGRGIETYLAAKVVLQ